VFNHHIKDIHHPYQFFSTTTALPSRKARELDELDDLSIVRAPFAGVAVGILHMMCSFNEYTTKVLTLLER
jgi:hypothetical protein